MQTSMGKKKIAAATETAHCSPEAEEKKSPSGYTSCLTKKQLVESF